MQDRSHTRREEIERQATHMPTEGNVPPGATTHPGSTSSQGSSATDAGSGGRSRHNGGGTTERAGQLAGKAQEQADRVAHEAQERIDHQRGKAADGLHTAADQMREKGQQIPGSQTTTRAATMAADVADRAASYVSERDTSQMLSDAETWVRDHPMQSLAIAFGAGFLIGNMLGGE